MRVEAGEQLQSQVVGARLIGRRRAQAQGFAIGTAGHGGLISRLRRVGEASGTDQFLDVASGGVDGHPLIPGLHVSRLPKPSKLLHPAL